MTKYPVLNSAGGAVSVGSGYIHYVENRIDSLFAGFFTVPFSSNNQTVKDIACDLVYARASKMKVKDMLEFEKSVMERIENIKKGNEAMIVTSGDAMFASVDGVIYNSNEDYVPVFGMSPTEYFEVDQDLIDDEENDRG